MQVEHNGVRRQANEASEHAHKEWIDPTVRSYAPRTIDGTRAGTMDSVHGRPFEQLFRSGKFVRQTGAGNQCECIEWVGEEDGPAREGWKLLESG